VNKLYLFIGILTIISCNSKVKVEIENDLSEMNLYGKIKYLNEDTYDAIEKDGEITCGEIETSIDYVFNDMGNEIKMKYSSIYSKLFLERKSEFKNGKRNCMIIYENGIIDTRIEYGYNEKGRVVEKTYYDSIGNLDKKQKYLYDNNENKIEHIRYNAEGIFEFKESYGYDKNDNLIWEKEYYSEDVLGSKTNLIYKRGLLFKEVTEFVNGENCGAKSITEYDKKGNEIKYISYNSYGRKELEFTTKYEYDKNHNWIKKIETYNVTPAKITIRKIDYF